MIETENRDLYLLVLDSLIDELHSPVVIAEIREHLDEFIAQDAQARKYFVDSTSLFHLLRNWAGKGLVLHSEAGYTLTADGERAAQAFESEHPDMARRVREAAGLIAG
jgi:hypothetical protein